jgi:hypothetical protein
MNPLRKRKLTGQLKTQKTNTMNQFESLSAESPEDRLAQMTSEEIRECNDWFDLILSATPVAPAEETARENR